MLPSMSRSQLGTNDGAATDRSHNIISHTQSVKALARPESAYVLFGGDKQIIHEGKQRVNIKQAR